MRKILFVCYGAKQRKKIPTSADVRCSMFAKHLRRLGVKTDVLNLNRYEIKGIGALTRTIFGFLRLLKESRKTILYVQKPGLAGFTAWMASMFKNNKPRCLHCKQIMISYFYFISF